MRISQSILAQIPLALARTGAVIRHNRVPLLRIVYAGLFSWAAVRRFSLPLDPVLDTDVIAYLGPALSYLNGGSFTHVNGLNFLYPGALLLILKTVHDLRAIVIVQHLLGLAAGVIFLRAWNRLHDLCPLRLGRSVHEAIGLVGAAILLLSNRPIFLELRLRSDAVCIFFQLLTLWLTLEFFHSQLVLCEARKALAYGCAAVASAWLLASLKPSFFLFALLTVAIVIWMSLSAIRLAQEVGFWGERRGDYSGDHVARAVPSADRWREQEISACDVIRGACQADSNPNAERSAERRDGELFAGLVAEGM